MEKPWFKLDPNNLRDRWWLYTSITDTKKRLNYKNELDIICYFIIHEKNMEGIFYRASVWFDDDPNRYMYRMYQETWKFDKKFEDMNEGDIVNTYSSKFKVYNCRYATSSQINLYKILERIEE